MKSMPTIVAVMMSMSVLASIRPPAVPLVQVDPFFSVWSTADKLTDIDTTHWSGARQPISIMLEVDGRTWRLCGAMPEDVPALPQESVDVRPTQTVCRFAQGAMSVELTFSTAKIPENLDWFSWPVTYVAARVSGAKDWRLKVVVSPALATNDDTAPMVTNTTVVAGLPATSIGRRDQKPLSESGDRVRCDWGYAWLVGPSAPRDGESHFMLAYDDVTSVRFFGDELNAWWRRNGLGFVEMLEQAEADRPAVLARLDTFDAELLCDLERIGGGKYAELAALSYRQSFAACKLVAGRNGQPLYFSKENASNGCMGTVDVFYPQFPHLLMMSPTLARATLAPILIYGSHPRWKWPFSPHDVGKYPLGVKQSYGKGENGKDETLLMPVEECGNMLICLGALSQYEGNADYATEWWPTVTKWAEYLARFGYDPGSQLCTDDFAGHLAHNANLSIKAIIAIACYAEMSKMRGEADAAAKYRAMAEEMAAKWCTCAKGGRLGAHKLALSGGHAPQDTWSQKYNLVWDRLLGLGLFPPEVAAAEMCAYRRLLLSYGLPLDSRLNYTKADWTIWSATITGCKDDFEALVAPLYRFVDETPDRIPFSDWYWADNGRFRGFIARSVVGGLFLPMLYDKKTWRKYASRDMVKTGGWASLADVGDAVVHRTSESVTVSVDFADEIGPVKPMNGVGQPPMNGGPANFWMMHYLEDAGIPYSRLHDVGGRLGGGLYVDIPNLFPDFDADENDPGNYRFAFTDSLVKALEASGVEPFFRLGVTIESFVEKGFPRIRTSPPRDFEKWARICGHVIRHYTEGWADGFKMKITYWEIWNEPENHPDERLNPMWGASFEEYVRFYGTVAPYLKAKFPHLKIGGYGHCGFYAGAGSDHVVAANSSPRTAYFIECSHKFLTAARDNKWPLDFFSFHSYSNPPEAMRQVRFADEHLNAYGFTRDKCARILNEWLPYVNHENLGTALQAAGVAAELIGLQNEPCDMACIYDAKCGGGDYSPLFSPLTYKPHKAYYAFTAFNELRRRGKAVAVRTSGDGSLYAAAAKGESDAAVMMANDSDRTIPLVCDFQGRVVADCRITDNDRTNKSIPMPAELPPRSFVVIILK